MTCVADGPGCAGWLDDTFAPLRLAVVGRLGLAWGALLRWSIGRLAGIGASVSLAVLGTLVLGA